MPISWYVMVRNSVVILVVAFVGSHAGLAAIAAVMVLVQAGDAASGATRRNPQLIAGLLL